MVPSSLWALSALLPLVSTANGLVFELSPNAHKRHAQHNRLAQKAKRATPVLPATWAYLDCYTDGPNRALGQAFVESETMTVDYCVNHCNTAGYIYAGVEYSMECYCDNSIQNGNTVATDGRCSMMCNGDPTQVCGGGYGLSVYKSSKGLPSALATYNNWGYQGCYTDAAGARTLTTTMNIAALTPQKCMDACHAQNFLYAGMEYSGECYCGNGFSNGGTLATDATTCDMTCSGDNTHICGGGDRLTLYKYGAAAVGVTTTTAAATTTTTTAAATTAPPPATTTTAGGAVAQAATTTNTPSGPSTLQAYNGWNSLGCYVDSVASRSLPNGMATTGGAAGLTVERCLDACHAAGYAYAGVEYSAECYCGTTVPTQVATDGRCSMTCNGNPLEYCGGGNGLNVYHYGTAPTTTTTTTAAATTTTTTTPAPATTTTTTAAATTTTTTPSGPSTLQAYNGWTSAGCYVDSVASRSLPFGMATTGGAAGLTVERCLDACHAAGYKFAGLEYSAECYCGTAMPAQVATDGRCTMTCNGNPLEYCGGGNGLTVYAYGTAPATTTTTTTTTAAATTTTTTTPAPATTTTTTAAATTTTTTAAATTTTTTTTAAATTTTTTTPAPATTTTTTAAATTTTTTTPSGPSTLQSYNGWTSAGCYVDSVATRSLPIGMATVGGAAGLTVERCLDACHAAGYKFAGLEYSAECYCGTTMPTQVATDGRCSMTCNGNPLEYCGGGNGLTVYTFGTAPATTTTTTNPASTPGSTGATTPATTTTTSTGTSASPTQTGPIIVPSVGNWISQGCWSDDPAARSLGLGMPMNGANSIEACTTACYNAGYPYAGTEYGAECYCGAGIVNNGALETNDGCNMVCNGNGLEYCGGSYRLNVYKYNGTVPPPTNPVPVGGGGGVTTPVTTGLPGTWAYKGCYVDNAFGRIMGYNLAPSNTNSAATCIAACQAAGFTLAGMEYSDECYCSNSLANGATAAAAGNADCAMACTGDATHACGGPNRISLYGSVANFNTYPVPTALKTNLPGGYTYAGCYAEPGAIRSQSYSIVNATANSVQQCLTLCSTYGYDAAGLEYGQECWCSDANTIAPKGGVQTAETNCNMPCPGSPADLCGGVNFYNLYTWPQTASPPLYVFNTPANTGHYELLIGGIVIPLIATLGLNNKVTFLEKYGTGAPNSTGAYELDYSLASDYTKAWRVMHVQSDVFCAANLVLPDRSGRILSVGGWSFESTEGVRLYTPSGTAGVNGTTDWEEHYDQIHLQKGRWYPGAMQMANGSIMIIGGEEGSNGAPVPSIEVLPKPDGGDTYLTMDWLLRTDPNNLYPFTFILPGQGIFVIYYNEARILDQTTFATTKTFPLIPGAVNAAGGRTYPMEGTAMVMPQYWPYSDPIEILACGGSAFGQAFDNCVSIQPEVDGAEWEIERMPTRRVMTIMTALPDGTYFIAGGAQAGVAGFGLANTPNLSALLYDPSKPKNQRISILGNTIVARLYHSEAILLHDGRILITGSDPEDQVNPQEYRMEVYVPPYRTDGSTPPTFTITNRDWTYKGVYTFQLGIHNSNNIRVSLMGGVSTTHGNSFGQRTFFPKVQCAGNVCQVTAPISVYVCPPGWYQMFVLDGPTPSYSQWVRIGGDPGNIGNWPNYPGFTLPGVGGI